MTSRHGILFKPPEHMVEADLVQATIADAAAAPWERQ
jgi:hypothetical protein